MVMEAPGKQLRAADLQTPIPGRGEVLIKVSACAVCRTDLHILDGELPNPSLPLILGHEIVGEVQQLGPHSGRFQKGDRVGVPWLGWTCGDCGFCLSDRENLCHQARFTGYDRNGGFAEYTVADERFCFHVPRSFSSAGAAPLLCAGLIGYRSLRKTGGAKRIGVYGFGAAAHIIAQVAQFQGRDVYAFTRPGDVDGQRFATSHGAVWAGDSDADAPHKLGAAIIFAPVGELVPLALKNLDRGGVVVCGGIHMSDIPSFAYDLLWSERCICSVANLTRQDGEEFLPLAARIPVRTTVRTYPLELANQALLDLRTGQIHGAAVLLPGTEG